METTERSSSSSSSSNWSHEETKQLLRIRGELDQTFMQTTRNKLLWEIISAKMTQKGFNRTPDQCKSKWKNLVTRYKQESKTMELENMQHQFPYYNELHSIFTTRINLISWIIEAEGVATGGEKKERMQLFFEEEEEEEEIKESHDYQRNSTSNSTKMKRNRKSTKNGSSSSNNNGDNKLKNILKNFMKQQKKIRVQWQEVMEARKAHRRLKDMEWRREMETLEEERLIMERKSKEREEQRRVSEEARGEKMDALVTAVLEKLSSSEDM
ncbi:SANT/Myb domain [Macleaya cordata]|uniref:SANT/Myb domain n=1 Tax=Macleaya cordata TaxID=56857 RepID=A0A200PLM7_MACCD|nr:SANT/Myb domain [Macleaya cordata]